LRSISFAGTTHCLNEAIYHDIAYCYESIGDYQNAEKYILQ